MLSKAEIAAGLRAPAGLVRQDNTCRNAVSWEQFDTVLALATAY